MESPPRKKQDLTEKAIREAGQQQATLSAEEESSGDSDMETVDLDDDVEPSDVTQWIAWLERKGKI